MSERLPLWLRKKGFLSESAMLTSRIIGEKKLNTVCREAKCPNRHECYSQKTATFMILGRTCTRNCAFCGINKGAGEKPDLSEPYRVAQAAKALGVDYSVVTSVTRDDLPDGGSCLFAQTVSELRKTVENCKVEVLIPDFMGSGECLNNIYSVSPDVINHNIETVPSLYEKIRPLADYERSLNILRDAKNSGFITKTGLIVGLGETLEEIKEVFEELASQKIDILTVGQYMRPSFKNIPVSRYLDPDEFVLMEQLAVKAGISVVVSSPLVRSSYRAKECFEKARNI